MSDRAPRFTPWLLGAVASPLVRMLHASWRVTVLDPHGVAPGVKDGESPAIVVFEYPHRAIGALLYFADAVAHIVTGGFTCAVAVNFHQDQCA